MGKFNKGDKFGGKKRFEGNRGSSSRRDDRSERPSMHKAICSDCGRGCEVPFRPTGDKPVFCSDCFGRKEGSGGNRFEKRSSDRSGSGFKDKQMFRAVCSKCHEECEVPFKPSGDKPVFCSNCFGKGDKSGGGGNNGAANSDQYKKQFEMLNNKLDNILKMLSSKAPAEKIVKNESKETVPAQKKPEKSVVNEAKKPVEKKAEAKKTTAAKKPVAAKKAVATKKADKKKTAKKKK